MLNRNNLRRNRRQSRGFSLIELSVVVGIISTLAAIAIPQFRVSVYQAHDVERAQMFGNIERMMRDYYNNNSQYPNKIAPQNPVSPVGTIDQWTNNLPGWTDIGFTGDGQGYTYRYSFTTSNPSSCTYGLYCQATVVAIADLDGNGVDGHYTMTLVNGDLLPIEGQAALWDGEW